MNDTEIIIEALRSSARRYTNMGSVLHDVVGGALEALASDIEAAINKQAEYEQRLFEEFRQE